MRPGFHSGVDGQTRRLKHRSDLAQAVHRVVHAQEVFQQVQLRGTQRKNGVKRTIIRRETAGLISIYRVVDAQEVFQQEQL